MGVAAFSMDSRSDDVEESCLLITAGMFLIIERRGGEGVALSVHVQQGGIGFRVRAVSALLGG